MAKRKSDQIEVVEVEQVSSRQYSEPIWEKYPNLLLYIVAGAALLFGGWWGYKELVVKPKQTEAVVAMWQAERLFARDSFQLALTNPGGGYEGFLGIADQYSGTQAGNMARYYAAVCYLQTGDYDSAINQMEKFSPSDDLLPALKQGILGDCYSEKEDYGKAIKYYEKAADASDNEIVATYYLKKLGMLHEYQGNHKDAIKAYERIRRDYANIQSTEWREIEKYIYRAKGNMNKQ